jgi:hypothetical protein
MSLPCEYLASGERTSQWSCRGWTLNPRRSRPLSCGSSAPSSAAAASPPTRSPL